MLPPTGQILENGTSLILLVILQYVLWLSSRGLAGVLPPAGQSFEKWHFLGFSLPILANFLCLPSRGPAGVLPPAGQSFEK